MKNLLVVESPAKAKTIGKYLGKDYEVVASFGHIRDLPSKNGSVEPDKDFLMHYEISDKSTKHVRNIVDKAKKCQKLILAPDPDREGESIAWHVVEILKQKKAIKPSTDIERVVFHSITKNSILEAIKKPRKIDEDLVNAQQARRALDYLVGFTLSPVLWKKLPGSRSAGRVQSVALRMICDREDEIEAFKSQEYWDIKVDLANKENAQFSAVLTEINGEKLDKFAIKNELEAFKIKDQLRNKLYQVLDIVKKQAARKPYPPFTTSSMQQEAARKLGFSAKKTMMIAQKLYEGIDIGGHVTGLITYMRTDSIAIAPEAITSVRQHIDKKFGKKYLPAQPNIFKSKVKNAQEAHEAIRPTDFSLSPESVKKYLDADQFALYDLVFKRAVASQMADVIFDQVVVEILTDPKYGKLKAVGSTVKFDGFHAIYTEDKDDEEDEEGKQKLPALEQGEKLKLIEVNPAQHFTMPPPRFSEASLVKRMEELGIGRPSTYAAIISVLQDRGYVYLDKKRFFPEERGRIVTAFLKEFFSKYVEYDYTANLEDELDVISNGELNWKSFLKKFWKDFYKNVEEVNGKSFGDVLEVLNQKAAPHIFGVDEKGNIKNKCPSCSNGILSLKLGKFGSFVGCSNYPSCNYTAKIMHKEDLDNEENEQKFEKKFEPKLLGKDPKTGAEIFVKVGPYGPYLELASLVKEEIKVAKKSGKKDTVKKPKRVSIPKSLNLAEVDLKTALKFLSLPREVGIHPETGEKIVANIGPFGPYLLHSKKFTSVKEDDILEIGLNRAVDLITENENKKRNTKPKKRKK